MLKLFVVLLYHFFAVLYVFRVLTDPGNLPVIEIVCKAFVDVPCLVFSPSLEYTVIFYEDSLDWLLCLVYIWHLFYVEVAKEALRHEWVFKDDVAA